MKTDPSTLNEIDRTAFKVWLLGEPKHIQNLAAETPPWFLYRVKPGAPYSTTGPGTEGFVYGYNDDGTVCFASTCLEINPQHNLGDGKFVTGKGQVHQVPENIRAHLDPRWLERIHEVQ